MSDFVLEIVGHDDRLVLVPVGTLDEDTVRSLLDALEAARLAGTPAAVCLDHVERVEAGAVALLAGTTVEVVPDRSAADPPAARGAVLALPTRSDWWLIDPRAGRLCRVMREIHPLFVPEQAWVRYSSLRFAGGCIVASTTDGAHLIGAVAQPAAA